MAVSTGRILNDSLVEGVQQTILVVEDDEQMRKALRLKFSGEGYDVVEAADGKRGLEVALAEHPDLILLDVVMPVMGGEEMLKKLREDAWGKQVPVIILTNMSFLQDKASDGRTDEHLLKTDSRLEDLVEKVRSYLKNSS